MDVMDWVYSILDCAGSVELSSALWSRLSFKDVQRVLSFLPVPDLCRYRIVCRRWNLLISTPEFGALCAKNSARRDASFIIIRYKRICESPVSSDGEDEPCRVFYEGDEGTDKFKKYLEEKIPAGCCILDLNTQRWHIVEDDDQKHSLKLYSEAVGMDGGLVCQYSFTRCEGNSVMVYNPIGKTLRSCPPARDHRTSHYCPPELLLHVDSTSRSFKFFLITHNFDDSEFLADPNMRPEARLDLLNDPLVRMYDSTTNQWKRLKNPSCIKEAVTDVCGVMFQGHLYVLVGGEGHRPLWRYNFLEDSWENLAVDMPSTTLIPQLVVCDNRLFVVYWLMHKIEFSLNSGAISRECRLEVSEIKIGDLTHNILLGMANPEVMEHFGVATERIATPGICPVIASSFGMNSLLFIAKTSRKPMVYDLKKGSWSTLPQIPLGRIHDEDYFFAGKAMNLILPNTPW